MMTANRTVRQGLIVGVIGYVCVAAFYSAFDLLASRETLNTVDLLGRAVFRGQRDPGFLMFPLEHDVPAILWYNALHLVLALAIGLIVTGLVGLAERQPSQRYLVLFAIVAGFVATIVAVGVLTVPMRPVLPWWSIIVANGLSTLVAGWYLLRQRPGLWRLLAPFAGR